jgi:hypothetical protein
MPEGTTKTALAGSTGQTVAVVTASGGFDCNVLPLELDATPIAIAVIAPAPNRTQVVVLISICACFTPAGLPGASGATSAAMAAEASKVDDKAMAIKERIIFPSVSFVFLELYTKAQQVQRANRWRLVR